MTNSPVYVIRDKELRVIKKDQSGMLCIFDSEKDAERFCRIANVDGDGEAEIVEKTMFFTDTSDDIGA